MGSAAPMLVLPSLNIFIVSKSKIFSYMAVRSKRLKALSVLVDKLSDRDLKVKKDIQLFEDFFENFPIPVSMWSITKDGTVINQIGSSFIEGSPTCLEEFFKCPALNKETSSAHKKAFSGVKSQQFIQKAGKVFYVSIVPRTDDGERVTGVSGIAWDVTSNTTILESLESILGLTEDNPESLQLAKTIAKKAISSSRIKSLVPEKK